MFAILGAPYVLSLGDFNAPVSALNARASVGLRTDMTYFSATLYHKGSSEVGEDKISSFNTLALFVSYDLSDSITLSLNVDNAFDKEPPSRDNAGGETNAGRAYINAGRVISAGVGWRF